MAEPSILAIDTATENCSVALRHQGQLYWCSAVAPQKHAEIVLPMVDGILKSAHLPRQEIGVIAYGAGPGSFTGVRIAVATAQALGLGLNLEVYGKSDLKLLVSKALLGLDNIATTATAGVTTATVTATSSAGGTTTVATAGATASAAGVTWQESVQPLSAPALASAPRYGFACIDARMGEVYIALYRRDDERKQFTALIEEKVVKPELALAELRELAAQQEILPSLCCAGTGIAILDKLGLGELLQQAGNTHCDLSDVPLYPQAESLIYCAQYEGMQLHDPSEAEPLYCRNEVTWKKIGEQ